MTEQRKSFPEFYVTTEQRCPYLANRLERKLFTHLTAEKTEQIVDNLLRGGFRRSQNIAYIPYCDGCQSCISVRVVADAFQLSRNLQRIQRSNADLHIARLAPQPTSEQFSLFRSYIDTRHGDGGMADMGVLDYAQMVGDTVVDTFVTEYRLRPAREFDDDSQDPGSWPLMGVALCDRLSDGISMIYSFYDVEAQKRSLGSFMILDHIQLVRDLNLSYLYLGYWIPGSQKMAYKARFQPQERLTARGWVPMPPETD